MRLAYRIKGWLLIFFEGLGGGTGRSPGRSFLPREQMPAQAKEEKYDEDDHDDRHRDFQVRDAPARAPAGFFTGWYRRISAPVRAGTARPVPDAHTGRRGLFPFRKAGACMVGRQPVIIAEVFSAVLAVERERDIFPAGVAAWHFSFFLLSGNS